MGLYAGLLLITLGIGYLMARLFQFRSSSTVVRVKSVSSPQEKRRSDKGKRRGFAGLSILGSRVKRTDKPMTMVRRSSALNAGAIQKPWGW